MGSVAVIDCMPLRDKGNISAGSGALAELRTIPDSTFPQSPTANASGQRTPGSARAKGPAYSVLLYAAEAVGRRCSVMQSRSGVKAWEKAQVLEYNAELGMHKLRYSSTKAEEWLYLSELKFKWSHVLSPTAPANPTYKPEYAAEAAVGKRLRVYWPAMQKWYQGTVRAYDAKTDKHTVLYKDGDSQHLVLRHEPVIWCDDEAIANGTNSSTDLQQQRQQHSAATTPRYSSSAATTPRAIRTPRGSTAAGAFAAGRPGAAGLASRPLSPRAPMSPRTAAATAAAALAASFAGTMSRHSRGPAKPAAAGALAKNPVGRPPAASKAVANGLPNNSLKGVAGPGSAGAVKQQGPGRPPGSGSALGKHARDVAGSNADSAAKRMKGMKPRAPGGPGTTAAAAGRVPVVTADKHLAVGCRVGVYWRLDKVFYRGKVVSYTPQSGKFTIKYDDGQTEAVLLEKERFVWHCPRAVSAGYRPALHTLMQQLGADGLKPLPQMGEDGRIAAETTGPEGAPHPPVSGAGAVGWRIKLYWPADQDWHEAEVLSFDEQRRHHHLLYLDGEEEWADLSKETVVWLKATRHGAISAGVVTGDDVPKGRDAIGWRIAVYWKDDRAFYEGELVDYEAGTGRHKVLYNDGEEEWLALRNERIIWRLAPKEDSDDDGSDEGTDVDALGSEDGDLQEARRAALKLGGKKRRLIDLNTRSDSGSASSGLGRFGSYPLAAEDTNSLWHGDAAVAADSLAGAAALRADRLAQGSCVGGFAPGTADGAHSHHMLHLSLKRGPGNSTGLKGRGIGPPPSGLNGKAVHRQNSFSGCGYGSGNVLKGGIGNPNLPPLQLKRFSSSGDGLGSPIEAAEQMQLSVRIVPGDGTGLAASKAAAIAGTASSAALQPVVQHLTVRQQRTAARLHRKMDRLHMILGKLATTAGNMGWKLDPQQMPTALLPADLAVGPKSPLRARLHKAASMGPTSPRGGQAGGPTSPRAVGVPAARASSTCLVTAAGGPTSPRANGVVNRTALHVPTSPIVAVSPTAAGKTVAVAKTCAVKSKPPGLQSPQQVVVGAAGAATSAQQQRPVKMRALLDVPAQPVMAACTAAAGTVAAVDAAPAVAQAATEQQHAQPVVAPTIRAAQIPSAVPPLQQQKAVEGTSSVVQKLAGQPCTAGAAVATASAAVGQPLSSTPTPETALAGGEVTLAVAKPVSPSKAAAVSAVVAAGCAGPTASELVKSAAAAHVAAAPPATTATPVSPTKLVLATPAVASTGAAILKPSPAATLSLVSTAPAVVPAVVAVPAAAVSAPAAAVLQASAATAAAMPAVVAVPVVAARPTAAAARPTAPPPALPNVSNPSAPSAHMTADDVVLRLQAMAGLQGSAGPALQQLQVQQLQQLAAARAAATSAAVSSPGKKHQAAPASTAGAPQAMETD